MVSIDLGLATARLHDVRWIFDLQFTASVLHGRKFDFVLVSVTPSALDCDPQRDIGILVTHRYLPELLHNKRTPVYQYTSYRQVRDYCCGRWVTAWRLSRKEHEGKGFAPSTRHLPVIT